MARGAEKKASSQGVNWNTVRILAVDDDPVILEYFDDLTKRFGVACDFAASSEEALRLVEQKGGYNIYFVDWILPEVDGLKLAKELKGKDSGGSIVVLISSAEWDEITHGSQEDAGIDKYVPKPFSPFMITDILSEYLGAEQSDEEGQPYDADIFEGRRILLVEDIDFNREIVQALLEPTRVEIECAENGALALRMFSEAPERYDLIFMDLQMPEMNGYEATRAIRALDLPKARAIPIIAMTASVFREDVEKCLASGMNGHIGKPLNFDEIISQLRQSFAQGPD
jgi:CheY-like chemotaxis protein